MKTRKRNSHQKQKGLTRAEMVRLLKLELPAVIRGPESNTQEAIEITADPTFFQTHAPEPNMKTETSSDKTDLPQNLPESANE